MGLRREIDRALDPGPGFPSQAMRQRILERLDEPEPSRPNRVRSLMAALGLVVLTLGTVITLLYTRSVHESVSPGSAPVTRVSGPTSSAAGFVAATMVDSRVGWIAQLSPSGVTHVCRTLDGGQSWAEVEQIHGLTPRPPITAFVSANEATIVGQPWLGSQSAGITVYNTRDARHWSAHVAPVSMGYLRKAFFRSAMDGWVITAGNLNQGQQESTTLWWTQDGGLHWERLGGSVDVPMLGDYRSAMRFDTAQVGWLYGGPQLVRTADGGRSWHVVLSSTGRPAIATVSHPEGGLVSVAESDGSTHVYQTVDQGLSWTDIGQVPTGLVTFITARRWLVAGGSMLTRSDDRGATFANVASLSLSQGWQVHELASSTDGRIDMTLTDLSSMVDYGVNQTTADQASGKPVDFRLRGTIPHFAVLQSTDGGLTWKQIPLPDLR